MIILLAFLFSQKILADESRLKIAVIDTGVSKEQETAAYMCKDGVHNFTEFSKEDANGHGSHISHIIGSRLNTKKYCISSYKVFHVTGGDIDSTVEALKVIDADKSIRYVNISMNGDAHSDKELFYFKKLTDRGVQITVAAGNEHRMLASSYCTQYPSCYKFQLNKPKNLYIVGAYNVDASNYGPAIDVFTDGVIESWGGLKRGTSQASAMFLSQLIKEQ